MAIQLRINQLAASTNGYLVEFTVRSQISVGVETFTVSSDTDFLADVEDGARAKLHEWALELAEATMVKP